MTLRVLSPISIFLVINLSRGTRCPEVQGSPLLNGIGNAQNDVDLSEFAGKITKLISVAKYNLVTDSTQSSTLFVGFRLTHG
jgi:hypothetical protein